MYPLVCFLVSYIAYVVTYILSFYLHSSFTRGCTNKHTSVRLMELVMELVHPCLRVFQEIYNNSTCPQIDDKANWVDATLIIINDAIDAKEKKSRVRKCMYILDYLHGDMRWKRWPETTFFKKKLRKRMGVLMREAYDNGFVTESHHIMHYFHKLRFKCTFCAYRLNSGACCGRRCKSSFFCSKHHVHRLRLLKVIDDLQTKRKTFPEFKSLLMDYLGYFERIEK